MTARKQPLRVVSGEEREQEHPSLLEAVESGDVLAIMKAQRRIIAESLVSAGDNTRPQYSNELNKLNALITAEEQRRSVEAGDGSLLADTDDEDWDQSAI